MKKVQRFLLQRFALTLFSLFAVITILFLLFRIVPNDPASVLASPQFSDAERRALLEQYGLTKPIWEQYVIYMANLMTGSFGRSFATGERVAPFVIDRAINTMSVTLPAVLLAFSVGPFLGATFSWNRGEAIDNYGTAAVLVTYAAPIFWTGMIALAIFSFHLGWLPSSGMHEATYVETSILDRFLSVDFLKHALMPITIFFLWRLSQPTLIMRNNMIDVLGSEYIELKRAEGLSSRRVLFHHAMRNALLPVVHYGALALGFAFGGSVILEQVFSWPGVGRAMFEATLSADYPVAQAAFFMLSVMIISMNFLADIVSIYLDPRVADEGGLG
jgi:peptide/nickel transport system permease protein